MTTTSVTLTHPDWHAHPALQLKRAPLYLRFVRSRFKLVPSNRPGLQAQLEWDALDQPGDTPADDEDVFATVRTDSWTVHVDGTRNGRRFGEWWPGASYRLCDAQPTAEILRDAERWRAWCHEQLTTLPGPSVPRTERE